MDHPCGSLPVQGHHVSLWWCEHHQCWWMTASVVRQVAEDRIAHHRSEHHFGPFDTWADVLSYTHTVMDAWKVAPGVPGAPLPLG